MFFVCLCVCVLGRNVEGGGGGEQTSKLLIVEALYFDPEDLRVKSCGLETLSSL